MVAKIIRGSSLYGALAYNLQKVKEETGKVLYSNRIIASRSENTDEILHQTMRSFDPYLAKNKNTEKPILHISLNPSPEDNLTNEQLIALTKDYMRLMNYENQPYSVYLHEDISRRHVHIVTTCVDENGKKINDSYEWKRSMDACRQLELKYGLKQIENKKEEIHTPYLHPIDYKKGDLKRQVQNVLKSVNSAYRFQTFGEYSALLSTFNIEAKQVKGEYKGNPYTGVVYLVLDDKGKAVSPPMKSSLFGKPFGEKGLSWRMARNTTDFKNKKFQPKIKGDILTAMRITRNPDKLKQVLQSRGIDAVFRKNEKGRIYGVTFIDHNAKEVYNGSRLGKEFSANVFENHFNGKPDPETSFDNNPDFSGKETSSGIAELFGFNLFEQHTPNPDESYIPIKKKKKKRRRRIT